MVDLIRVDRGSQRVSVVLGVLAVLGLLILSWSDGIAIEGNKSSPPSIVGLQAP